jgi:hypothetical protein
MNKQVILFFIFILFVQVYLYSQPHQKRELILKNRVLEMREYQVSNDKKTLSAIYYFNDSGLVEKEIDLRLDSIRYDTTAVITNLYDSQNRKVQDICFYRLTTKDIHTSSKIEYISRHKTKLTNSGDFEASTFINKRYKRNNLTIYKSKMNSQRFDISRERKYKYTIVVKNRRPLFRRYSHSHDRKSRGIIKLDGQGREIKTDWTSTHFIFKKKHFSYTIKYEGDLLSEKYFSNTDSHYAFEYKKGIKLNSK